MQENYDHYISRNIKGLYRRRLFGPLLYLIFIIAVFIVLPVTSVVFPTKIINRLPDKINPATMIIIKEIRFEDLSILYFPVSN